MLLTLGAWVLWQQEKKEDDETLEETLCLSLMSKSFEVWTILMSLFHTLTYNNGLYSSLSDPTSLSVYSPQTLPHMLQTPMPMFW